MLQASAENESLQVLFLHISHSCLFSVRIHSYNSSSAETNYNEPLSTSISSYFVSIAKLSLKNVLELQHFQLCVRRDKEAYHDWFFMFHCRFGQLYLVKLIVDVPELLKHFIVENCFCLLVNHNLVTEWLQKLHKSSI